MLRKEQFTYRMSLASDPKTSPDVLLALAKDSHPKVRICLAQRKETPAAILESMIDDEMLGVRMALSEHKSMPPKALERLAFDTDRRVRMNVARNSNTSRETLEALAKIGETQVCAILAKNHNASYKTLQILSKNQSGYVSQHAAGNIKNPQNMTSHLYHYRDEEAAFRNRARKTIEETVSFWSADQEFTDEERAAHFTELNRLSNSKDEEVRRIAARDKFIQLPLLERLSHDESWLVRHAVARNLRTSPEQLRSLFLPGDLRIFGAIAGNPLTPPDILAALSDEKYGRPVVSVVASNPSTPASILTRLSFTSRNLTFSNVLRNSSTPKDSLHQLCLKYKSVQSVLAKITANPSASQETLRELSLSKFRHVRLRVARNPNSGSDILVKLSNDPAFLVKYNLILRPDLPQAARESLLEDLVMGEIMLERDKHL